MSQIYENFVDSSVIDDNLEPWQRLDNVMRQWASLSGFQKDQELYSRKLQVKNFKVYLFIF